MMTTVGLISDTHGLLRPEAIEYLGGCDIILHGGDVGKPEVIAGLEAIAPVHAIRGNVDRAPWASAYPETMLVEIEDVSIYLVHSKDWLDLDPLAAGIDVVLCGHSHKPLVEEIDGVTYVNPGSAGPRRFSLPVSLGRMKVNGGGFDLTLHEIES